MLKLNVPDMSCGHCVSAITEAIRTIDPAADVKTDLSAKSVTVQTTAPADRVSKAVDEAGYPNTRG